MKSLLCILSFYLFVFSSHAQNEKVKNQPYVDERLFHLGFHIGFHFQDIIFSHTGEELNGESWFAEIPYYKTGFTVGVIGNIYLNKWFDLRITPTFHFGEKKFVFKEYKTGKEEHFVIRSNYIYSPVEIKYSAFRINNYRPYLIGGIYHSFDMGRKQNQYLLLKGMDYGVTFGIGCDFYFPYFKLCPEIKICLGLKDIIDKNKKDRELLTFQHALYRGVNKMIVVTFNFE